MAKQKWLTEAEKQLMEDALRRGVKREEIARVFNRHHATITRVAKGIGMVRPYTSKPSAPGELLSIMESDNE